MVLVFLIIATPKRRHNIDVASSMFKVFRRTLIAWLYNKVIGIINVDHAIKVKLQIGFGTFRCCILFDI